MPLADFIHLKVRSAYSLTEGANKVDKIVALAKDNAMPAVIECIDRGVTLGEVSDALRSVFGEYRENVVV